jgi:NADH dehydrogenase FAD-containing subunit
LNKDRAKVYYIGNQAESTPHFNKSLTINKSSVSIMTKKAESATIGSCIIVGGGLAGIQVARGLQKLKGKGGITVTVVDRQNYLDWSLASPRSVVAPDDVQKFGYVMPLTSVCEFVGADFVQGAVDKIGPKSVTLEDGTTLEADCVVVAIGGQYASGAIWKPTPDQTTTEKRIAAFRALNKEIVDAKSIVVAGAGPTGVEVAGEIKAAFPDTTVTMVGTLLPSSPEALQTRMKGVLEKMGVVVQEGRVDVEAPDADGNVKTRDAVFIKADLVLNAAGFIFAGAKLADETLAKDLTARGQFNCRPTLQLQGCDTVYCCGDVLAVPEGCFADVKGSSHADSTADIVAANIILQLQGKESSPALKEFAWSKTPINKPFMTALGPKIAVGYIGMPHFLENFMARSIKCKDYYMSLKGKGYGKGKTWK